jgi:hypothetical protein
MLVRGKEIALMVDRERVWHSSVEIYITCREKAHHGVIIDKTED